jgi:hypothetical protein
MQFSINLGGGGLNRVKSGTDEPARRDILWLAASAFVCNLYPDAGLRSAAIAVRKAEQWHKGPIPMPRRPIE